MAPLILEGETLGEKRKYYNKFVNQLIANKNTTELSPINFEDEDFDNLLKIDIACNIKNVEYVLNVLKCEDMLYVSRVIKQSKWLINDDQYAHIINPEYLFEKIFPQMTSKAKNKFLLAIRLNLTDEQRVESFCKYVMMQNIQVGLKWLPHCSIPFIEKVIAKHAKEMPTLLMKRLCKRSIKFLEIYLQQINYGCDVAHATLFLLNQNAEKFLEIVEPSNHYSRNTPQFGPKPTQKIMKKCPEKIINKFENYADYIHIQTFAKFIKKNEIKSFILKHIKNDQLNYSFRKNVQYFLKRLPNEEKFEFVKVHFIDKTYNESDESANDVVAYRCCSTKSFLCRDPAFTSANIYNWYKFAPYNTAFHDIKKLIKTESNPSERNSMLTVILQCAGKDMHNIQSLVQYYRENHINEPFKFKTHFINILISKSDVCKYDLKTWGYLNEIFTSMEVYEESSNDVQLCIKTIILYSLVNNKDIPKIVQDKFVFDTLKIYQNKLNAESKEKVFNYLFIDQITKLNQLSIKSEREFVEALTFLENILNLLKDWKKNLSEHAVILEDIKKLIIIKNRNSWNVDMSKLYNLKKSWRKLLFNESISIHPTAEAAMNALKHGPELINIYEKEIVAICSNENMILRRFLNKIRVFWSHSLAITFKKRYLDDIIKKQNYASSIFGLSNMLPQKDFLKLIHEHEPTEAKIDWSQSNESELSLRRNLAKRLHLARPQPPLAAALLYAKGDYLQYVLPSLSSILYNISSVQARDELHNLLNAPVSLQKHGIRTALNKLQRDEFKYILTDLWNSTKNSSIRADIIHQTFKLLCKQRNDKDIEEIWSQFKFFIEKLTTEENKDIYATLCRVHEVPLSIKADVWMTSFNLFKSLPERSNRSKLIDKLKNNMVDVIELLDPDFIANMYLENFDKNFTKQKCDDIYYLAIYLLSAKSTEIQNTRYHKVLLPIIEKIFVCWDVECEGIFYSRTNLTEIFISMINKFEDKVLNKDMIIPVVLFNNVYLKLSNDLPLRENYFLITLLKLLKSYFEILDGILNTKSKDVYKKDKTFDWNLLHIEAAPQFAKVCVEYLKSDVNNLFASIYVLFSYSIQKVFHVNETRAQLSFLKNILEYEDFVEGHLLVLKLLPKFLFGEEEKSLKLEILNKIKNHPSEQVKMYYWNYLQFP